MISVVRFVINGELVLFSLAAFHMMYAQGVDFLASLPRLVALFRRMVDNVFPLYHRAHRRHQILLIVRSGAIIIRVCVIRRLLLDLLQLLVALVHMGAQVTQNLPLRLYLKLQLRRRPHHLLRGRR